MERTSRLQMPGSPGFSINMKSMRLWSQPGSSLYSLDRPGNRANWTLSRSNTISSPTQLVASGSAPFRWTDSITQVLRNRSASDRDGFGGALGDESFGASLETGVGPAPAVGSQTMPAVTVP